MPQETNPFEKLLGDLANAQVPYLTMGGVACALCGFVRTTEDIDIIVARDTASLEKMLSVLRSFGEGHARELTPADFSDEEGSIRVVEEFPLDIFVRMRGHSYEDLLPYREWHSTPTARIPYINAEGLILLKKDSYREKDQIDVSALRRIIEDRK
jgi:hypothetical protein